MMKCSGGILILTTLFLGSVFSACPDGWAANGDQCYWISSTAYDYTLAQRTCQNFGGELMAFNSDAEKNFVESLIYNNGHDIWFGLRGMWDTPEQCTLEGWQWTDNSQPGPTDFDDGKWECDGRPCMTSGSTCATTQEIGPCGAYIWWSKKWTNHPCGWAKAFICRRSSAAIDMCNLADGWHHFSNKCYKTFDNKLSWSSARAHCQSVNGDLVLLKTDEDIKNFELYHGCKDYSSGLWIGLSDKADNTPENNLYWLDGENFIYYTSNFASGQPPDPYPNPYHSNCVASFAVDNYKWYVQHCDNPDKFVCEKPEGTCADGWKNYDTGYCYLVVSSEPEKLTYTEAKDRCMAYGGGAQLMKVASADEQQKALVPIITDLANSAVTEVRIGVSDMSQDNTYRWADYTDLSYTNWNDTLREQVPERMDCGYIPTGASGEPNPEARWGTKYCFDKMSYICRIPIHSKPVAISKTDQVKVTEDKQSYAYMCSEGWRLHKDHCYQFLDDVITYTAAKDKCIGLGSGVEVTTIRDADEQAFISNNLQGETWIGLIYDESEWKWEATGQQPTFKNWASDGKSSQDTLTCCRLQLNPPGQWYNTHCTETPQKVICRKAATPSVPPGSTAAPTAPVSPQCGGNYYYDSTSHNCYGIRYVTANWDEAEAYCVGEGAHLASIRNSEEQHFVNALLSVIEPAHAQYWIGLNDKDQTKGWVWSDGSPVAYFNWQEGEPNDYEANEKCVEFYSGLASSWNDYYCTTQRSAFICKKLASDAPTQPPSSTTPATLSCTPNTMVSGMLYVQDQYITASSSKTDREPWKSRIFTSTTSWEPSTDNNREYIQVMFPFQRRVHRIWIAGAKDKDAWVTKFQMMYTVQAGWRWNGLYNGTQPAIFTGNTQADKDIGIIIWLDSEIFAQGVRIYPQEWHTSISMRFDIEGCQNEAATCLYGDSVSGDVRVTDDKMTASSSKDGLDPTKARINSPSAWEPATNTDTNDYLQLEFDTILRICEIRTLGRKDGNHFTKTYKLSYYNEQHVTEDKWEKYMEPYGTEKIFSGNVDNINEEPNLLFGQVAARKVRIYPLDFHNNKALRVEIKACLAVCQPEPVVSGPTHRIADDQLTASSTWDSAHAAHRSRLYMETNSEGSGAWAASVSDANQWIQADLGWDVQIQAISTQGHFNYPEWVITYTIQYSSDGNTFIDYKEADQVRVFSTASDSETVSTNYLDNPVIARYMKLRPVSWNNHISMRWEVHACPGPYSSQHVGCYSDNTVDRDLPYGALYGPDGGMTREVCTWHCYNLGYDFAGTQYSSECFCGNSYGRYGPSSQCYMVCTGDPGQICGGPHANNIYTTGMSPMYERCADGWEEFQGMCYHFYAQDGTGISWHEADYQCSQKGGKLASILSAAENNYITGRLAQYGKDAWIGLHCQQDKKQFEWVDYQPVLYTNWDRREPNNFNGGEDCVNIYMSGLWNDYFCADGQRGAYVCKRGKDSNVKPPPATVDPNCGQGWKAYRWKCFVVIEQNIEWNNHKTDCEGMGATLARIADYSEQAFLASEIAALSTSQSYWLDLNDQVSPGTYIFSDGRSPPVTYWAAGQPDQKSQASCVHMSLASDGLWMDDACSDYRGAICEKPNPGQTQPPTQNTPPASPTCPPSWQAYNGYCYLFTNEMASYHRPWESARQYCASMGANLVSIHSDQDNSYIWKNLVLDRGENFWIGLYRATHDVSYEWSDGQVLDYTSWASGQPPTAEDTNCVLMAHDSGDWISTACAGTYEWACALPQGQSLLTTVNTPAPTPDPAGCGPGNERWLLFNERCYYISDSQMTDDVQLTWWDAENFCLKQGGHLASIHSEEENNFIKNQFKTINSYNIWLGLNELDGREAWSDGSALQYVIWANNEPDNRGGTELCGGIGNNQDYYGRWTNLHCTRVYDYICIKSVGAVTQTIAATTVKPGNCRSGYVPYGSKCFKFVFEALSWSQAKANCYAENDPYSLASIHSAEEQAFIISQLKDGWSEYWIGMAMDRVANQFYWTDNTAVTYTNWNTGEPNGGRDVEECVEVYHGLDFQPGTWNDKNCDFIIPFICNTYRSTLEPTPTPGEPSRCDAHGTGAGDYMEYDGNCYKLYQELKTWQEAEDFCKSEGGHLATIANIYDQSFLFSSFKMAKRGSDGSPAWIGLSDKVTVGAYKWVDGYTVMYVNWDSNQPDITTGGCTQMLFSNSKWGDEGCETTAQAICKITYNAPSYTMAPPGYCPSEHWTAFGGYCYRFIKKQVTLLDARAECFVHNSDLVSIHSPEENSFIQAHCDQYNFPYHYWTGLTKTADHGYAWMDGSPADYFNWAQGEPNDRNGTYENCAEMYPTSGLWNDARCDLKFGIVCKVAPAVLPPSSTPPPPPPTGTNPTTTTTPLPTVSQGPTAAPTAPQSTTIKAWVPPPEYDQSDGSSLSAADIVAIVFGVTAFLLAAVLVGIVWFKLKRQVAGSPLLAAEGGESGYDNPVYGSQSTAETSAKA